MNALLFSDRWRALQAFDVDAQGDENEGNEGDEGARAGALSFVARLARENAWSLAHAQRVFDEYKRFVFLAVECGHAVTPSEEVDQAWHLHLVYTRSYWDDLCSGVLGRALHHGPTKGGVDEGARFDAQYRATLASYARIFATPPPAGIWPAPEQRFGGDLRWRRVWTDRAWVIPKRATFAGLGLALATMLLLVIALVTS